MVFKALEEQFDTPAHQRQIESIANSLTIDNIRKQYNCSRIAALGILYHEVVRLNAQFPKEKRGEAFKVQTLMKIVENHEWSRSAEEEVMQNSINYERLYTKLSAALVVWENEVRKSGQNPEQKEDRRAKILAPTPFIGYGSTYATNPKKSWNRRKTFKRSQSTEKAKGKPVDRSNVQCFRCKRFGHFRSECTLNYCNSMIDAAWSRIQELGGEPNQAAAKVLFELALEEDEYQNALPSVDKQNHTFEALLSSHLAHDDSSDQSESFNTFEELAQQNQDSDQNFEEPGQQN